MLAPLFNKSGEKLGEVELPEEIFNVKVKPTLLWEVVKMYLANKRAGTHHAKTRGEVKGSRRKIWPQKGLGRARHGDRYAPIFVGGGKAHGPRPRDYYYRMPKKAVRNALKMALTDRAKNQRILLLDDMELDAIKTKKVVSILNNLQLDGKKVLFVPKAYNRTFYLSARNIPKVDVHYAQELNALHVLNHEYLVLEKQAIDVLKERLL